MTPIYVTEAIFHEPTPQHPYRINLNDSTMNALYRQYKEYRKLPIHFPISTRDRLIFERGVFRLIERGDIVVVEKKGKKDHGNTAQTH